jgi:hypothetical protein
MHKYRGIKFHILEKSENICISILADAEADEYWK